MRYSNTTLKELTARYRAVLKKCAIFNACLFLGFTVSGAAQATPVVIDHENQVMDNVSITGNTGTAIRLQNESTLTINGGTISGNTLTEADLIRTGYVKAGAAFATQDLDNTLILNNVTVSENVGPSGVIGGPGKIVINGGEFSNNTGGDFGVVTNSSPYHDRNSTAGDVEGGPFVQGTYPTMEINGTRFENNEAKWGGAVGAFGRVTITDASFEGNKGTDTTDAEAAGAILVGANGQVEISGTTSFKGNSGTNGGAILTRNLGTKSDNSSGT